MKKLMIGILIAAAVSTAPAAQTLSDVPGSVVYWRQSPSSNDWWASNRIYTTSPSIAKLPNGDYLIAFNLFGASLSPSAETSGTTYIYRSSDQGQTWTNLTPSPMMDMKRGSLFVHEGAVYLWGYTAAPGYPIIRKSTDNGTTWSVPTVLDSNTRGGTPMNPVIFNNESGIPRVWCAVGGKRMMSGRSDPTLIMDESNWSSVGSAAKTDLLPDFGQNVTIDTISEAQIVASPQTGIVVMPKVEMGSVSAPYFSYTVLLRARLDKTNVLEDATVDEWVALPGGEKKFGASYDPVSGRFYVLSNPVLPAHESGSGYTWQLIRNTAAMLSSKDLHHWDVEQIFLYSPDIDHEGFQYLNFDYDGDDMIIASRTAFDIRGESGVSNPPPRGHDSNMITFHRISNFRNAAPDHFLKINGSGELLRKEQTQHEAAPLGFFALGSSFDGAPLDAVNGMAQDTNGDVYVRENGGRILRFDALGNFIETAVSAPVSFQSSPLSISQPAYGERTWISTGGGNWEALANWFYWGRPDTDYEVANLGSAISDGPTDLILDKPYTMKGLRFRSPHRYRLEGTGQIIVKADSGSGLLDVQQGDHRINIPFVLDSDMNAFVTDAAELRFNGSVDLNGRTLTLRGQGRLVLRDSFVMNGGRIVLDGQMPLTFSEESSTTLNGTLEFVPDAGLDLSLGAVFQLLDGSGLPAGPFTEVILPALPDGLVWDDSNLYTDGTLAIAPDLSFIDLVDFARLASWWLDENCETIPGCLYYDLEPDGVLNSADLQILAEKWLGSF